MVTELQKIAVLLLVYTIFLAGCGSDVLDSSTGAPEPGDIESIADRVYHWQMAKLPASSWNRRWLNATLFRGVTEAAKTFQSDSLWQQVREWAEHNKWRLGEDTFNADNQAAGLVYLELYERFGKKEMILDTDRAVDSLADARPRGRELWWWSDALYMAPPVLAKMGEVSGDKKYINILDELYWDASRHLYDTEYKLYYRDERFFGRVDAAGNPVFWSRGNGWVAAGLVRLLQLLPEQHDSYEAYRKRYREIMASVVDLQPDDGLWRTSLLSPELYPQAETSGTSFFCYAIAWGVNEGLLEDEQYRTALLKAWEGLLSNIDRSGKLGSVQSVASAPGSVDENNSEIFATGAFLLAASEMYRWSLKSK